MTEPASPLPPPTEDRSSVPIEPEELPRQFGKYTLLRRLAAGGMAELFLALHRSVAGFEKLIVIKRILPQMNQDRGFIDMLLHEARIAATLSHPNIVQIFDVGQVESKYFIAMEHIHGEDIRSIVRAMKKQELTEFPLEHTIAIVLGLCAGLAYAHDKRDLDGHSLHIVHRDVSPQNIVVTFTGDVKIVDFGIAKSGAQLGEDTKDGQLKGKVPYMSPEQASGESIDWRSDIFAAGVMLFELTTGKRLFKGASEYETLKLICDRDYPRPSEVRPGYPPALEAIVLRALAKDRADRYQSAREMQSDLEAFVREERVPVSPLSLSRWMQSLFEDKLAAQREALQDVKQLADIIAGQQALSAAPPPVLPYDEPTLTTGAGLMTPPAPVVRRKERRSAAGAILAAAVAFGLAAGGVVYYQQRAGRSGDVALAAAAPGRAAEARGTLRLESDPPGCDIWVNGELARDKTPTTLDRLPLGREISLRVTRDGYEAHRATVSLTEAAPSQSLRATLRAPLEEPKPATTPVEAKPETAATAPSPKPAAPGSGVAAPEPGPASGPPGKVRVNAKGGYCNVTINGTSYGPTPVEAVVPAGPARVRCTPDGGTPLSQAVKVGPGETVRVAFKL